MLRKCKIQSAKSPQSSYQDLESSDGGGAGGASHLRRARSLAGRTLPVDQSQGGDL